SILIEILQIFTFRLTDIDDLITNTLGAILGYSIAKIILARVSYKISEISNDNAVKNESVIILIFAFLISFLLKPLVSNSLWEILLESSLWEKIK
ncbi:MAG: VanZ family protein, partial [Oscillospiraceae bacterium]|nr:VanZ family protein [Oscillospiraceae bacterium]